MRNKILICCIVTIMTMSLFACGSNKKVIKLPTETTSETVTENVTTVNQEIESSSIEKETENDTTVNQEIQSSSVEKETETSSTKLIYYEKGGKFYKDLRDYSKYIELGQYTRFDVKVKSAEVTDEQIQESIDNIIEKETKYKPIKKGVVLETDTVNMDYTGKIDGIAFVGGSATGYTYKINGNLIDSLDDQLPGLKIGETYELNVKFPDNYLSNPNLAGKDAVFTVKINYVHGEAIVPEWNDDFVKAITKSEYTTTEAYEEYIKKKLREYNLNIQKSEFNQKTWEFIIENCKIKGYPEEELMETTEDYFENYIEEFKNSAKKYGMTYENYRKLNGFDSDEALKAECEKQAKSELEYIMIGVEIAKKEQLAVTEEIYNVLLKEYIKNNNYEGGAARFEQEYGVDYIMKSFVFEAACSWLYDNNNLIES